MLCPHSARALSQEPNRRDRLIWPALVGVTASPAESEQWSSASHGTAVENAHGESIQPGDRVILPEQVQHSVLNARAEVEVSRTANVPAPELDDSARANLARAPPASRVKSLDSMSTLPLVAREVLDGVRGTQLFLLIVADTDEVALAMGSIGSLQRFAQNAHVLAASADICAAVAARAGRSQRCTVVGDDSAQKQVIIYECFRILLQKQPK